MKILKENLMMMKDNLCNIKTVLVLGVVANIIVWSVLLAGITPNTISVKDLENEFGYTLEELQEMNGYSVHFE